MCTLSYVVQNTLANSGRRVVDGGYKIQKMIFSQTFARLLYRELRTCLCSDSASGCWTDVVFPFELLKLLILRFVLFHEVGDHFLDL